MTSDFQGFARSRMGAGFFKFVLFCALISAAAGYATYVIGLGSYTADKREEKVTALALVDALRHELFRDPQPARQRRGAGAGHVPRPLD